MKQKNLWKKILGIFLVACFFPAIFYGIGSMMDNPEQESMNGFYGGIGIDIFCGGLFLLVIILQWCFRD